MFRRFIILLLVASSTATLHLSSISAQDQQRPRTVVPADPSASPRQVQPPSPPPGSRSLPLLNLVPLSLADLKSRIEEIARQPALEPGFFAVKIVSLDTNQIIYEQNANKFVRPASNMKLYTVATAFDRLTPDYHFVTSVYTNGRPEDGKIKGDLIVYGRGDPSIAARFNNGDYFKGINDLADRIVAAGVKRVKGDLVGDESYFNGAPVRSGWEWEDLTWTYVEELSALTRNDNAIDLTVKPGVSVGFPVVITSGPPAASFMTIANRATTSARGSRSDLHIYRGLGANTLEISGSLPLGDNGFIGGVAIPDPALAFVSMLRDALVKRGVKIDGRIRTVKSGSLIGSGEEHEIATFQSPPFSIVAAQT